jgi:hypothetical protein
MKQRAAYSFLDVLIIVGIIGLLLAITIPAFLQARQEHATQRCIENLREMAKAKTQCTAEKTWADGQAIEPGSPEETTAVGFLKNKRLPSCRAGGVYRWNPAGKPPTCSKGPDGHQLPAE